MSKGYVGCFPQIFPQMCAERLPELVQERSDVFALEFCFFLIGEISEGKPGGRSFKKHLRHFVVMVLKLMYL